MIGYVYILANGSMPGLLKFGRTSKKPQERADELNQTGTPSPFVVVYYVHVSEMELIEAEMHKAFEDCRISKKREFFKVDVNAAIAALNSISNGYISNDFEFGSDENIGSSKFSIYFIRYYLDIPDLKVRSHVPSYEIPNDLVENESIINLYPQYFDLTKNSVIVYGSNLFHLYKIGVTKNSKKRFEDLLIDYNNKAGISASFEVLIFESINEDIEINKIMSMRKDDCISYDHGLMFLGSIEAKNFMKYLWQHIHHFIKLDKTLEKNKKRADRRDELKSLQNSL